MKTFDLIMKSSASGSCVRAMTGGYLDDSAVCSRKEDIKTVVVGDITYRFVGEFCAKSEKPYYDFIERTKEK